jgi:tetratricopeptide (TPR) repeat protein
MAIDQDDITLQVRLLAGKVVALNMLGRHDEILSTAQELATKAAVAGTAVVQAAALRIIVSNYISVDQYEIALTKALEAATLAAEVGEFTLQANTLSTAAFCLTQLKRYEEALALSRQAANKASEAADLHEEGLALRWAALCLSQLDRDSEAIVLAREAVAKLANAGSPNEQVQALTTVAFSLIKLGQQEDATTTAIDAFELAGTFSGGQSTEDTMTFMGAAAVLLVTRPSKAEPALKAYSWILKAHEPNIEEMPRTFFDCISYVATSQKVWPQLIALLEGFPEAAARIMNDALATSEPGRFLTQVLATNSLEDALVLARHFVTSLAQAISDKSDKRLTQLWGAVLNSSTEATVSEVSDARYLREFAEILAAHRCVPTRAVALASAAASYHAAGRDVKMLARLDPDLATMLTTIFTPKKLIKKTKGKARTKKR